MPNRINISEVVTSFYSDLKTVAADLNAASDELGKCIAEIDDGLKTLNLGITVWAEIGKGHGDFEMGDETYWSEEIGYSKWGGRWGICLRKISGDAGAGEEICEQWLFNEAPRALRLKGADYLVTLLQTLNEEGAKTAEMIRAKAADTQEVAGAITQAAFVPKKGRTAGVQVRFEEAK
jgi:hypothetical protein